MANKKKRFVSGFVSLIGRPNAGKSTLLNALIGAKLAIVADKPQTTRMAVQGVWNAPGAQIVFLDTPGIHRSDTLFNRRMMQEVRAALEERDVLLYLADATRGVGEEDAMAIDMVRKAATPSFLVLTKIDLVQDKRKLLPKIEKYREKYDFQQYIPISAVTGEGLDLLTSEVLKLLPEGVAYFPREQVTDQPERFLAAEMIREKILHVTEQEVPHSVAVLIENWEEGKKLTRIAATIYVERDGQKAIVIGSKGAALKEIGTEARKDIEAMLGRKVFLEMFVKVRENWRESPEFLTQLDWRTMSGGESKA
ncbi:MAG TPA: GTPase Era [Bryobacteraceae bacterium]|nr:GTPase Era [Bryobacteraceae bacterium]